MKDNSYSVMLISCVNDRGEPLGAFEFYIPIAETKRIQDMMKTGGYFSTLMFRDVDGDDHVWYKARVLGFTTSNDTTRENLAFREARKKLLDCKATREVRKLSGEWDG